jgi:hypothetical protein
VRIDAQLASDGAAVLLSVSDNGRGMSEEVRKRAGEMFFTTKARGLGTGLGLALVRRVAENAGGRLEIESAPGRGATIRLLLPAAAGPAPKAGPRKAILTLGEPRAAALIEQMFLGAGIEVLRAEGPGDADLWVVRSSAETVRLARAWLGEDPGRRLVMIGRFVPGAARPCDELGVTITDIDDINAVRSALGRALSPSPEERPSHDRAEPRRAGLALP